jgi:hypothetical protein
VAVLFERTTNTYFYYYYLLLLLARQQQVLISSSGSRCLYLRLCGILIEMADVFFSLSWRILEPYGCPHPETVPIRVSGVSIAPGSSSRLAPTYERNNRFAACRRHGGLVQCNADSDTSQSGREENADWDAMANEGQGWANSSQ